MTRHLFVTGMLRSGTSLAQTLLTNHPQMWVVYQPFHQFYVDVKQLYLDEHGLDVFPPLYDGAPGRCNERDAFTRWLGNRKFSPEEAAQLAKRAVTGKGGSMMELEESLRAMAGSFATVLESLHMEMARHYHMSQKTVLGSKEVLCEEYIPALLDAGFHCITIIRDPRAVVASANNGRYLQSVGDRYPLLMLIRLWRKSADCWLAHRDDPRALVVRYEDLVSAPVHEMHRITTWLGLGDIPSDRFSGLLLDHAGRPWTGNSSFGEMATVDGSSTQAWRGLLARDEIDFIESCTATQMAAVGYAADGRAARSTIEAFVEDTQGVRESYLAVHELNAENRVRELEYWDNHCALTRSAMP